MRVQLSIILLFLALVSGVRYFPDSWFYKDITDADLDPESADTVDWLSNNGGWGGGEFRIDFSMQVLHAGVSTPTVPFNEQDGYYLPDCDDYSGKIPLPPGGKIEGENGYDCTGGGDCHLIVVDNFTNTIWEGYQATLSGSAMTAICLVEWDMCRVYPDNLRGDQCTSTDAAGFPVSQLLFNADEIASGEIDHAIRFILPNPRMRRGNYVHPGTHAGGPSGPSPAPIYGSRWRLKNSFDDSSYSPGAKIVIAALKKYGMFLADGGNIALTAQSDDFTKTKWSDLNFDSHSLIGILPSDFDVVQTPTLSPARISLTDNCVRNTLPKLNCTTIISTK